jgi:hypothetical protein
MSRKAGQFVQSLQEYREELKEELAFPSEYDDEDEEKEPSAVSISEKKG